MTSGCIMEIMEVCNSLIIVFKICIFLHKYEYSFNCHYLAKYEYVKNIWYICSNCTVKIVKIKNDYILFFTAKLTHKLWQHETVTYSQLLSVPIHQAYEAVNG